MVTRYVGQPIRRTEDLRLVTGAGRYTDDIGGGDHALEAAFVRSPHAHARIADIDVTDALDVEGVVAIYTYEDLEGAAARPWGSPTASAEAFVPGASPEPPQDR